MTLCQVDLRGLVHGWESKILSAFDQLCEGMALEVVLDRDPNPLHFLFLQERARLFRWECKETSPETWKVQLLRVAHGLGETSDIGRPSQARRPGWVESLNPACALFLDIRPLMGKGLDPFQMVIRSAKELKPGQHLHLVHKDSTESFAPALARLGYEGYSEFKNGSWNSYFRKGKETVPAPLVLELDVRGQAPPLPMLKVLESLPSLSEGGLLKVIYPHSPENLADKLQGHGFKVEWEREEGGVFILHVWKEKSDAALGGLNA